MKIKVQNRKHLHDHFIELLLKENELDEAKYWCKDLQIDMEQLKPEWKAWIEEEDANHDPPIVAWESESNDKVYHRLVIEPSQIIFVDDVKIFEDMCDELKTEVSKTLIPMLRLFFKPKVLSAEVKNSSYSADCFATVCKSTLQIWLF